MPTAFKASPEEFQGGTVRVRAVVSDLFETMFGSAPESIFLSAFAAKDTGKRELNRLAWTLAGCHTLWHPSLRGGPAERAGLDRLLIQELAAVASVVRADSLFGEEDRREELVRRVLRALGRIVPGETGVESEDRLRQLDSVERQRVLAAAADRERRSREVREEMARKAAEEAAAKVSRE
ncbi:MAG TPA: hypothetical protein VI756_28635 [Blastocatellia bacterium]